MLITGIRLSGWRSYSPEHEAHIGELGRVNLVIGANNVGKSNLGRFLVRLREILQDYEKADPWSSSSSNSNALRADGGWFHPLHISFFPQEVDHWLRKAGEIKAEILLDVAALGCPSPLPSSLFNGKSIRVSITMTSGGDTGVLSVTPMTDTGLPIMIRTGSTYKLMLPNGAYSEQVTFIHPHRGLGLAVCRCLALSIIEIRPLRDPGRKSAAPIRGTTDGGDIISALQDKQNDRNNQLFWTRCKADLETWFTLLLGEDYLRIEINTENFWLEVKRGRDVLRCPLADLGAGVSEILIVLAYLRLYSDRRFFVVIDEPESHLHPGAVVELAKIITEHLPNHQLLVTTHSTALIDAVASDWRTFRATRAAHHGTALEPIETTSSKLALLADLGIRPSQLFLARVVLWVEGPSDIHYWTALIRQVDDALVAGRDFAFVTYGGASSSHMDFGDDEIDGEERLVQVLKVAHRAIVICDRDRNADEDERTLVDRLVMAAKSLPQHALVQTSCGREIENDVKPEVFLNVLEELRPKYFLKPKKIDIEYEPYAIGKDDAFDLVVANAARLSDGTPLSQEQRGRVETLMNQRKNRIAERVKELGLNEQVFEGESVRKAREIVQWLRSDPG
ncbi:AAA family ATPase [Uliginosibacterium sp. H3]|uniref:AAA family ATPase n=1 Tax=Uliginosibacterium silvisoli TaxID=3114758 RepID=A0ABU6K0T3_9RHOO|nr:AAA family ATPase [Uliginosibacterium sp. H3]